MDFNLQAYHSLQLQSPVCVHGAGATDKINKNSFLLTTLLLIVL